MDAELLCLFDHRQGFVCCVSTYCDTNQLVRHRHISFSNRPNISEPLAVFSRRQALL
jgi:hypothetical protein